MHTDPHLRISSAERGRVSRPSMRDQLRVTSFGITDRGRERETNQDRFLTATLSASDTASGSTLRGYLFAVADGVGGANGGDHASLLAVETIEKRLIPPLQRLCAQGTVDVSFILGEMRSCFRRADTRITSEAAQHAELRGMATTLTMAACIGRQLFVAHAGDSRCYMMRDGALRCLTDDHTVTAELVRRGLLTPEMAAQNRFRHVLTEYVGGGVSKLHVETKDMELAPGDVLLLCTDGLTEMVSAREITAILQGAPSQEAAASSLIRRANDLGGHDNVTAVVARCDLG